MSGTPVGSTNRDDVADPSAMTEDYAYAKKNMYGDESFSWLHKLQC